eukprot:10184340-Ditylum_brightwellii.AAC.1
MSVETVEGELNNVYTYPVYNKKGEYVSGKEADEGREHRFNYLKSKKQDEQHKHASAIRKLKETKKQMFDQLCLSVTKKNFDSVNDRVTWVFSFGGANKDHYDNLAIQKLDWNKFHMVAGSPEGITDMIDEQYLVDMDAVVIDQVKDGYGTYHQLKEDDNQNLISDMPIDYYHGTYKDGMREGDGILYTTMGIYSGQMKCDQPCGEGYMDYANGDKLTGEFGFDNVKDESMLDQNPYTRCLPNGKVKISFADGGYYEGEMKRGEITGKGIYINATGDQYEGQFIRGDLSSGKKIFTNGEVKDGIFKDGHLDGIGTYTNPKSSYRGCFKKGLFHGKGIEKYVSDSNEFEGFFTYGKRMMHGEFSFCVTTKGGKFQQQQINERIQYSGPWLAGSVCAGGKVMGSFTSHSTPSVNDGQS